MAKQDVELQFRLIDGVTKSLTQIQKGVTGLGASIISVNQAAELTSKVFSGIGRAADAFGGAITGAGDFQDALAALQAVTGASSEEFDRLKAAAIEASERTKFSSIEAAQGLTELARAGLSATDAIATLNPVLALAQGQQLDVARASEFVTITLTQFGLAAQDAGKVADVLASAADKSQLNVEQLGNSLSYAAPLARQLGLTLEETTAIIGKLADEGFRGERSGTALRNVFSAMTNPASEFSKALDEAGVSTSDFNNVIDFLGNGTDDAKKALLSLDAEARPAILALSNKGSAGVRALREELDKATGAAQRTSDILGDTFNQALDRLGNSIENVRNAFLDPLLEPFAVELDNLALKFNEFAKSEDFARLRDAFAEFAVSGAQKLGEFIAKFDFNDAAQRLESFYQSSKVVFEGLAAAAGATAKVILFLRDAFETLQKFDANPVQDFVDKQKALQEQSAKVTKFVNEAAKSLENFGKAIIGTGKDTSKAAPVLDAFGYDLQRIGLNSKQASDGVDALSRSAEELPKILVKNADAAREAALGLERLALARAADALAKLGANANQSSAEFQRLKKEVADSEERIRRLTESGDRNKDSVDKQTEAVKRLKQELRDLGNEQDDVNSGNERLSEGNSQVSESFGSITISLGNLSGAFVRTALEAAGAAGTIRGYIDTLNSYFAEGARQEEAILRAIDVIDRQNAALSDEDRIRRQLIQQYGESSTLIEVLLKKKLELLRANKANNDESQREIDLEKEKNAGIAGGLGTGNQAQQSSAATGNRNGGGSAANRGESAPISITINQNGATPETIRELTPLIERELIRLGALRR